MAAAAAFVQALKAEYVDGQGGAVGEYFDAHGDNPQYDAFEEQVRNAADPAETINQIAEQLGVGGGPRRSSVASEEKAAPHAGGNTDPTSFVIALRAEFSNGAGGAVGDYFDSHGENLEYFDLEEQVRNSEDPVATIDKIAKQLGIGRETRKASSVKPQVVGKAGDTSFIHALQAEFLDGAAGAVGEYFDKHGEHPDYLNFEEQVRNSGEPAATIDQIASQLGVKSEALLASIELSDRESNREDQPFKFDFEAWCANNSLLSRLVRKGINGKVEQLMKEYGQDREKDEQLIEYEFSFCEGLHMTNNPKIEIEDAKSAEDKRKAVEHLERFEAIVPAGMVMWFLVVLAAIINCAAVNCRSADPVAKLVIALCLVAPGAVWMIYWIARITGVQTLTVFEGVPFVRFIHTGCTLSSYRLQTILALSDWYGQITRRMFVGEMIRCSFEEEGEGLFADRFELSTGRTPVAFGVAMLIFFLIPMVMQTVRMLRSRCHLQSKLAEMEESREGDSMGIFLCLDDYGAMADWAFLRPPAEIFFVAATPLVLEDENDAERIWDLFRTRAYTTVSNLIPDAILQLWLMSIYFSMLFDQNDVLSNLMMALSLVATWASTLIAGVTLIKENFRLTFYSGVLICVTVSPPVIYVFGAFACPQGQFFSISMQCLSA